MWQTLRRWFGFGGAEALSDEEFLRERDRLLGAAPVPVFWLFGKTGSGKSSIVRFLTGAERAEIGAGFRPQTQRSEQFDFPSADNPLMRFLDTRGLGEARYDPAEDLREFDERTHVVIVTVRVLDHALADIVEPLRAIRQARPDRPVLLALTRLHEAYPGEQHPQPDPFSAALFSPPDRVPEWPAAVAGELQRSIAEHQSRFAGLVDRIVPLDLTKPEEGFAEPCFGGDRLKEALLELLPAAYRQTLLTYDDVLRSLHDLHARQAEPVILAHSSLAATAAALPVPWADIPFVIGVQSRLVYALADIYGQSLDARTLANMAGAVGGRLLTRYLIRETLKFIPYVGVVANVALAYAYTYGLGKAACWYFGEIRAGHAPSAKELERVWREEITRAAQLWSRHHAEETGK